MGVYDTVEVLRVRLTYVNNRYDVKPLADSEITLLERDPSILEIDEKVYFAWKSHLQQDVTFQALWHALNRRA